MNPFIYSLITTYLGVGLVLAAYGMIHGYKHDYDYFVYLFWGYTMYRKITGILVMIFGVVLLMVAWPIAVYQMIKKGG